MTAAQNPDTFSRPARLIGRPWSSPSQFLSKTNIAPPIANKNTVHHSRHDNQKQNYLSGVRKNPQRMSYIPNIEKMSEAKFPPLRHSHELRGYPPKWGKPLPPKAKFDMILEKKKQEKLNKKYQSKLGYGQPVERTDAPKKLIHLNNSDNSYIIQRIPTNDSTLSDGKGFVTIISSPNDVLQFQPEPAPKDNWDQKLDPNVCRKIAGLTKSQLQLCRKYVS